MSSSATSRLGLIKPNPGTGEPVNVATHINASMDKIDAAVGAEPALSTALPASPYHGKFARGTDNRKTYIWNATQATWDQILTGPGNLITVDSTGKLQFGAGAGTYDANLYRSAADTLKTDDNFDVGGTLTLAGKPLPGTQVAENMRDTPVTGSASTELIIQSVTFNAVNGARYRVDAVQHGQTNTLNANFNLSIRWATGATVTAASTMVYSSLGNTDVVNRGQPYPLVGSFVSTVTGQVTVGISMFSTAIPNSHGAVGSAQNIIIVTAA